MSNERAVRKAIQEAQERNGEIIIPENVSDKAPKNPVVIRASSSGREVIVHMPDNRHYRFIHPGVRKVLEWRDDSLIITEKGARLDSISALDNFFENCVQPEGHNFTPTLDNISPEHVHHWQVVRGEFLGGTLVEENK